MRCRARTHVAARRDSTAHECGRADFNFHLVGATCVMGNEWRTFVASIPSPNSPPPAPREESGPASAIYEVLRACLRGAPERRVDVYFPVSPTVGCKVRNCTHVQADGYPGKEVEVKTASRVTEHGIVKWSKRRVDAPDLIADDGRLDLGRLQAVIGDLGRVPGSDGRRVALVRPVVVVKRRWKRAGHGGLDFEVCESIVGERAWTTYCVEGKRKTLEAFLEHSVGGDPKRSVRRASRCASSFASFVVERAASPALSTSSSSPSSSSSSSSSSS